MIFFFITSGPGGQLVFLGDLLFLSHLMSND